MEQLKTLLNDARAWFERLSGRERRMVLATGGAVGAFVVFLIFFSFANTASSYRKRTDQKLEKLREVQVRASSYREAAQERQALEQQLTGFITFGLKPYIDAVEDEFNDKVYRKLSRFVEFTVEGLLRADSAGRSTYYGSALGGSGGSGWMTINEVREKENLPPLDGDEYNRVTRWEMQSNVKT